MDNDPCSSYTVGKATIGAASAVSKAARRSFFRSDKKKVGGLTPCYRNCNGCLRSTAEKKARESNTPWPGWAQYLYTIAQKPNGDAEIRKMLNGTNGRREILVCGKVA